MIVVLPTFAKYRGEDNTCCITANVVIELLRSVAKVFDGLGSFSLLEWLQLIDDRDAGHTHENLTCLPPLITIARKEEMNIVRGYELLHQIRVRPARVNSTALIEYL